MEIRQLIEAVEEVLSLYKAMAELGDEKAKAELPKLYDTLLGLYLEEIKYMKEDVNEAISKILGGNHE